MGIAGTNCPSPTFATIGAAVAGAAAGATIYVCAGLYPESVAIDKNITLLGAQAGTSATSGRTDPAQETVIQPVTGDVFTYSAGVTAAVVDGFTILGQGENNGIVGLNGLNTASWKNNIASNTITAMNFFATESATITGNRLTNNDPAGNEAAIFLTTGSSKNVTIDGNAFSGNGVAVNTPGSPENSPQTGTTGLRITHNTSVDDVNFLVLTNSSGTLVDSNTVTSSLVSPKAGTGLFITGNNVGAVISNNSITGGAASGIGLNNQFSSALPSSGTTITGNTIDGRTNGIRISPSTNAGATVTNTTITNNTVSGSTVNSISVQGGTGTNVVDNSFTGAPATTTTADCVDTTTGPGTAATADTWKNNIGNASLPRHLCNAAGSFIPVSPTRVLDTRVSVGGNGPIAPTGSLDLTILGQGGVPASNVTAVVLNLTVTNAARAGSITAYPSGTTRPNSSNLNFVANQVIPNQVIVKVGSNGAVRLFNNSRGTVQLVADVAGYYVAGTPVVAGAFRSLVPTRILDSRSDLGVTGPVGALKSADFPVLGQGGIPASGVSAVVLNVTVAAPEKAGYLTVYPYGANRPNASNLNFAAGQDIPNLTVVKVGDNGRVAVFNGSAGSVSVIADVAGYYLAGTPTAPGTFVSMNPFRILDTRFNTGAGGPVAKNSGISLQVGGNQGIPTSVSAVTLNVTVTAPTNGGNITVYPNGGTVPLVSNLNFVTGLTIANLTKVQTGTDGRIALYNNSPGTVQLVGDVAGYFVS